MSSDDVTHDIPSLGLMGEAVRPVMFNDGSEWLWGFGTCFFVQYLGSVYGITAGHVLDQSECKGIDISIYLHGENIDVPIVSCKRPWYHDTSLKEAEDIVFLEVDEVEHQRRFGRQISAWNIAENILAASSVEQFGDLVIAGYHECERYDYEKKTLSDPMICRAAKYLGPIDQGVLFKAGGPPSKHIFNGLSGSPVFYKAEGGYRFVGMVQRGSQSSGILNFLGAEHVLRGLSMIMGLDIYPQSPTDSSLLSDTQPLEPRSHC